MSDEQEYNLYILCQFCGKTHVVENATRIKVVALVEAIRQGKWLQYKIIPKHWKYAKGRVVCDECWDEITK